MHLQHTPVFNDLANHLQLALCRFLFEHKAALGALAGMTAAQLGWSGRPVVSVTPDTCAMVALWLMADKAIAGIGVVSQSGALIGNFSYSDLRSALSLMVTGVSHLCSALCQRILGRATGLPWRRLQHEDEAYL